MKNYSVTPDEVKVFILNYKIEGNQIIINFANKKKSVIPYTLENEKKILDAMEKQVKNSEEFLETQKFNSGVSLIAMLLIVVGMVFATPEKSSIISLYGLSHIVLPSIVFVVSLASFINSKLNINDVNKTKLFLESKQKLNEKINSNEDILSNTKLKKKDIVNSDSKVTINTIRKIKLKELKQIVENIDRNNHFNFDYSESNKENKTLIKK